MPLDKRLLELRKIYLERVKPKQDEYWNSLTQEQKQKAYEETAEVFEEFRDLREQANCKGVGWHTLVGPGVCKYCGVVDSHNS